MQHGNGKKDGNKEEKKESVHTMLDDFETDDVNEELYNVAEKNQKTSSSLGHTLSAKNLIKVKKCFIFVFAIMNK